MIWIIGQSLRSSIITSSLSPEALSYAELTAFSVYFTGMFFEVIGDLELYVFKSNPKNKGKLLTTGLRQYTRHPNYFGNALVFWAFYLCTVTN
jgi:steroid 5-alpha reductase family enzyme